MKSFKIAIPENDELKIEILKKINDMLIIKRNKIEGLLEFYKIFDNLELDSCNNIEIFKNWPEPEITITELLNMEIELQKKQLPEWLIDAFNHGSRVIEKDLDSNRWQACRLSHIEIYEDENTEIYILNESNGCVQYISQYDAYMLGSKNDIHTQIKDQDLLDYDLSKIPHIIID